MAKEKKQLSTVEILYKHPNPLVMAGGPRILDFKPAGRPLEFYEPEEREIKVGKSNPVKAIVYTVNPMYARRLLSAQPERYFLLSPDKLIVPVLSEHGLRRTNIVVKSILLAPEPVKVKEAVTEPEVVQQPPKQPPQPRPQFSSAVSPPAPEDFQETAASSNTDGPQPPNPLSRPTVGEE